MQGDDVYGECSIFRLSASSFILMVTLKEVGKGIVWVKDEGWSQSKESLHLKDQQSKKFTREAENE